MDSPPKSSRPVWLTWARSGVALLDVAISALVFLAPENGRSLTRLAAALGVLSLTGFWPRFGMVIPLTIAGIYFGLFFLDPTFKGGDQESQMRETAGAMVLGAILGLVAGLLLNAKAGPRR